MPYKRKVSFNERFYLATDRISRPFCNQMIFEGTGIFDIKKWRDAVARASEANPGSRLVFRGFLNFSTWADSGVAPRIREVDGGGWECCGNDNTPFLREPLDPYKGPSCEVVLIHGSTLRAAFRTHHGVMDGRGTLTWAEDVFRCLRGEEPLGSTSTILDYELAWKFQKEGRTPPPHEFIAPTGKAADSERGVVWKREIIQGRVKNFLPQVALLVAREAHHYQQGKVRLAVPSDLREHEKGLRSTGNLTNILYIMADEDSSVESIRNDIAWQIENYYDCKIYHREKAMYYVPISVMAHHMLGLTSRKHSQGFYHNSGIISNLGRLDLSVFSGGGFTAESWLAIPPSQEILPLFIGMAGWDGAASFIMSMPGVLATEGRFERLFRNVYDNLIVEAV